MLYSKIRLFLIKVNVYLCKNQLYIKFKKVKILEIKYCDICHGAILQGSGLRSKRKSVNYEICAVCRSICCSDCTIGSYCINCWKKKPVSIQQKALLSHKIEQNIQIILKMILILSIISLISVNMNLFYIANELQERVNIISIIILIAYLPIKIIFSLIILVYQNILWKQNL